MGVKKFILVRSRRLCEAAQKLAAICFIATGLGAYAVYVNGNLHQVEDAGVLLYPKASWRNVKGGNSFTILMPLWIQLNFKNLSGYIFKRNDSRISPPITHRARQSWMWAEGVIRGRSLGGLQASRF